MASSVTTTFLSRSLRFATTKPYYYAPPIPSILTNSPKQAFVNRHRLISSSMASDSNESPSKNPGLRSTPQDEATKDYIMQQTMYRIKDPEVSLKFYSDTLGMSLLKRLDFPDMKFSLYFMGYEDTSSAPKDPVERIKWTFSRKATIELTHNWGTENDRNFQYHNGNSEPRGFGHIGITVDNVSHACARFREKGVTFVKYPDDGKMKGIAFIKDPDGYWIEIFDKETITNVQAMTGPKP